MSENVFGTNMGNLIPISTQELKLTFVDLTDNSITVFYEP